MYGDGRNGEGSYAGSSEMRELVFHLSEAIRSDQPGSLNKLKESHEVKIREAEDGIRRICKKKFMQFINANSQMEGFKQDLGDVRKNLVSINEQIGEVR